MLHVLNADQLHVASLGIAAACSLDLKDSEVKGIQERVLDERQVLDIFEGDGLLDLEHHPLAKLDVPVC